MDFPTALAMGKSVFQNKTGHKIHIMYIIYIYIDISLVSSIIYCGARIPALLFIINH